MAQYVSTINWSVLVLSTTEVWINGYLVDFKRAEISVDSKIINVEPKVLAVLIQLYKAKGEIVSQPTLMANVWADVVVSPNTLQRCITLLRKLLGDNAKQQDVIKTHPKLGYSLNPQSLIKSKKTASLISTKSKSRLLLSVLIMLVLIPIIFYSEMGSRPNIPSLRNIKPLTTNGQSVHEFVVAHSGKFSVMVLQQDDLQQLIYKELTTQKETVLVDILKIKGNVAISLDDQTLAFGLQTKNGNKKCVKLVTFDLINQKIMPLTSCQENFNHSPQWIDNQNLVYLSSKTNRSSELHLYDIKQKTKSVLTEGHKNTTYLSYQTISHKLAWITEDGKLTISTVDLDNKKLIDLTQSILPVGLEAGNKLHWYNKNILVIPYKNSIYWFEGHELVKQQSVMSNRHIIDVVGIPQTEATTDIHTNSQPRKVIALFSQKDIRVRTRKIGKMKNLDIDISPSVLSESGGKYRPETNDIAVLSNKSGSRQLWLASNNADMKLTENNSGIEQFVWLNKQKIIYLSEQKLWLLSLGEEPVLLTGSFLPVRLYQAKGEHLLVSVIINNKPQLIWFNINSGQFETLLYEAIYWAQRMSDTLFISSGGAGKLAIYREGKLSELSALPPLTIQSSFIWSDNNLYLQDKKLNVWRYDPINEVAEIIGQYDINALFMTDFKPSISTIVTDNFLTEQRDLVWLSEE
ncbi:MAG: DNA-binding winged helix-turn-helix (wHTH) protein [Colwellia sp.]